jgi:hypothetical protein
MRSSFPPTSNFVLIIAHTQRPEFPAYLCILSALFTTHTYTREPVVAWFAARPVIVVRCECVYYYYVCCMHTHTHTHNAHNLYIYFALRRLVASFFFRIYFFNTYIHLHKRHHRNAEQNAERCLSPGAHRQSARPAVDVREMSKLFSGGANRP